MKVLWITNILVPGACEALGMKPNIVGGWLQGLSDALQREGGVELAIASTYTSGGFQKKEHKGIIYYYLPCKDSSRYDESLEKYWKELKADFCPSVIHIHGTEFAHGLAYLRACGSEHVVVSIQGLVSAYYYYYYGISKFDVIRNITPLCLYTRSTIFTGYNDFKRRGVNEKEIISKVGHIIGRTSWDRARTWAINPKALYHFCNETLRAPFYNVQWDINKCKRNTIFLSQASSPIKGLHQLLKALPLVLRHYPETKVRIAGQNIIDINRKGGTMRLGNYGRYIFRLIEDLNLHHCVEFIGPKNADQMVDEMLNAHVFVSPSTIENSPNSLGEAQLLGLPSVSSLVGGVADMVENKKTGLTYRFEETSMLAKAICDLFGDEDLCRTISANGREVAMKRHNPETNTFRTIEIYKMISIS